MATMPETSMPVFSPVVVEIQWLFPLPSFHEANAFSRFSTGVLLWWWPQPIRAAMVSHLGME